MNKRTIFLFVTFLLSAFSLFAQNNKEAEKIVKDLIKRVENNSIRTNFKLIISENDFLQEQEGVFLMQKKKFSMCTETISVFFDGDTQWTYMAADNEVNINSPTDEQLREINPLFILSKYKEDCLFNFIADNNANNKHVIAMQPRDSESEFSQIIVTVNKLTNQPISIKQINKEAGYFLVEFLNFEEHIKLTNTDFVFDKNKYKGVFENDLR